MKYWVLGMTFVAATSVANASFEEFVGGLKAEARQRGMDENLISQSFNGSITPIERAVSKSRSQPEFAQTFNWYVKNLVSPTRVEKGRANYRTYQTDLTKFSAEYGIPAEVIVALWGMESHYGSHKGKFPILPSLATLAYKSHRKDFFRREFFHALQIVEEGHIPLQDFTGSWAGAMGQCQFMPSSFLSYAQDGNGDGKRDIWQTQQDVFASAANYLKKNGWKTGEKGLQRVVLSKYLPADMKFNKSQLSEEKTVAEWQKLGLIHVTGEKFPAGDTVARLFLPEGPSQKAYLVYHNFNVIMRWNQSTAFAFSTLTLAKKIAEGHDA